MRDLADPDKAALSGVGLHTGKHCRLRLAGGSSPPSCTELLHDSGRTIAARLTSVVCADRRVVLANGDARLETPEHLLAAVAGLAKHRLRLVVEGPELPALDGSARPFADFLESLAPPPAHGRWVASRPFTFAQGEQRLELHPADALIIDCAIEFDHPAIGRQRRRFDLGSAGPDGFLAEIAPARTFGLLDEADRLARRGLAAGASLQNALVFDRQGVLNPDGLRFADEPVRHKILDALGDIALLGAPLQASLTLQRPSHRLMHLALATALRQGALIREE